MKVVGVGLNKTGTTTLGVCLQHWGLHHISYNHEAFELWRLHKYDELLEWVGRYDSFEDWPWPLVFREINERFPGTKFILTRRKDAQTWYTSLCKHAKRSGPTDYRKHIYGWEMPHEHPKEHMDFYEKHLEAVRSHFRGRPNDLLEVCWEEGDGWDELASFLGFEQPNIPFPHANRAPRSVGRLEKLAKRIKGRLPRTGQ
ncbi:MAG: hypothetical protein JXB13_19775 [Phycisphaerae bacterium]|nr:hypothetical protein [Phycisphaerae bacterium]